MATRIESANFTGKETQVVARILEGKGNREIAAELGMAIGTVKVHVSHILEKVGVKSRLELVVRCLSPEVVSGRQEEEQTKA